jgi:predicted enzyme related to lactoylglutathione lyase
MAGRITEFSLDCRDPEALAGFWAAVLGWEVRERSAEGADVGRTGDESWHVLADPEGNEFCLLAGRVQP